MHLLSTVTITPLCSLLGSIEWYKYNYNGTVFTRQTTAQLTILAVFGFERYYDLRFQRFRHIAYWVIMGGLGTILLKVRLVAFLFVLLIGKVYRLSADEAPLDPNP